MARPEVDSEYVLYRTPAGRQSVKVRRVTCDRCGLPLGRRDPLLQGADPDAPAREVDPELIPVLCQTCSVACLLKPSY